VILCFFLSVAFGVICGALTLILWLLLPLPGGAHPWVATGGVMFGMAACFWVSCPRIHIATGFVGVPTYDGKRIQHFPLGAERDQHPQTRDKDGDLISVPTNMSLFSEGTIKVPPLFGAVPVNVQLKTSEEKEVRAASKSGMLMTAKASFQREVVNPFIYLSADKPDDALFGIAGMIAEAQFPCYCYDDFKVQKTKDSIRDKIKEAIDEEDYKYGLNVKGVIMSEFLPPADVLANYAKLEIEIAQAKAEKTEWDAVLMRVQEAADKYKIDINRAFEYFQAERGKAQAVRNTHRLEGLEPVVQLLGELVRERNHKPRRRQS